MRLPALLLILLFLSGSLYSATIHVPADQSTVVAGMTAALSGDTVLVSPGTYSENIDFLGKDIVLLSELGPNVTTLIPAIMTSPTIVLSSGEGTGAEISGFTFTGTQISNAIRVDAGSPFIHDNIFTGNNSTHQGMGVLAVFGLSHPTITRNLFYDNPADYTFWSPADSVYFVNNTIDRSVRGIGTNSPNSVIKNNIVTNCTFYGFAYNQPPKVEEYNLRWNNATISLTASFGPTDLNADPMYTNPLSGDYTLSPISPAIDRGDPAPQFNDPDGTRNDMGAFPATCTGSGCVVCGDADGSGSVDFFDIEFLTAYYFQFGPAPDPLISGDSNCDDIVDISDIVSIAGFLNGFGSPPCCTAGSAKPGKPDQPGNWKKPPTGSGSDSK